MAVALLVVACKRDAPVPEEPARTPAFSIGCPEGTMQRGAAPPDGYRVWCETAEGVSHGPFRAWYPTGQKKSEGAFEGGEAHGEWVTWHVDGKLRSRGSYDHGAITGDWTRLDRNGEPAALYVDLEAQPEPERPDEPPVVIGVPACDLYLHRYRTCMEEKMPQASRRTLLDALDKSTEAWKEAAAGPGRDALEQACKLAFEAAAEATAPLGCEW